MDSSFDTSSPIISRFINQDTHPTVQASQCYVYIYVLRY